MRFFGSLCGRPDADPWDSIYHHNGWYWVGLNPYDQKIKVEIHVYDQDFQPVTARISPSVFQLGSQASRPVLVVVPFSGAPDRKVRICTQSIPFPGEQTQIRAQICGKFFGHRRS